MRTVSIAGASAPEHEAQDEASVAFREASNALRAIEKERMETESVPPLEI